METPSKPTVAPKPAATPPVDDAPSRGKTFISDEVVSVIARLAAEQVEGVHQIGSSNLRGVFSRMGRHGGIESEVGFKEAAIDVDLVVEFGYPITRVTDALRRQIVESVEYMTGRKVVEVNINVVDVHIPRDEKRDKRRLE